MNVNQAYQMAQCSTVLTRGSDILKSHQIILCALQIKRKLDRFWGLDIGSIKGVLFVNLPQEVTFQYKVTFPDKSISV